MKQLFNLSILLLCVCMLLSLVACGNKGQEKEEASTISDTENLPEIWKTANYKQDTTLGEGSKTVKVTVEAEGCKITFTINTDAATLGEAMQEHKLLSGDQGEFGMYIKTVNGMLADYDVDGTYWGFYQNGEYMMSGVDTTAISGGESYELVRTKG